MRSWWNSVRPAVLSSSIYWFLRILSATIRTKSKEDTLQSNDGRGRIVAGWHGRSLLAALHFRNRGWYVLISHSRDGEIAKRVWTKLGYNVLRGSTGTDKGGVRAAAECARKLREGATLIFSPDGPKGPSHIVQDGLMWLAQKGNARILPGSTYAKPSKKLRSWDKYLVPFPFARCLVILGEPIDVPENITDEEIEVLRQKVQESMNEIEARAEREL